jgi:hypothetical protein
MVIAHYAPRLLAPSVTMELHAVNVDQDTLVSHLAKPALATAKPVLQLLCVHNYTIKTDTC